MYKINILNTERTQRTKKIKQKRTNDPFKNGPVIFRESSQKKKNNS